MTPILFLALTIAIPILIAVLLRVNAAVLFMSLCVGEVLVLFVAGDANSFANAISPTTSMGSSTVRLILLLLPMILTTIFMFHSINGGIKIALNVIPAIAVGLLTALLIAPLLPGSERLTIQHSNVWHQLSNAQTLVVGVGALLSMAFLWLGRHGSNHGHHGHHKHHR